MRIQRLLNEYILHLNRTLLNSPQTNTCTKQSSEQSKSQVLIENDL